MISPFVSSSQITVFSFFRYTFAEYAKRNNIETIEYNNPAVEVELPHIFNEEYEKREERSRKNKECSQIISEITRKMNGDYNTYDKIKVFTNENQAG